MNLSQHSYTASLDQLLHSALIYHLRRSTELNDGVHDVLHADEVIEERRKVNQITIAIISKLLLVSRFHIIAPEDGEESRGR